MTEKEFEDYLVSIGGLENGYYPDRGPITTNICECGEGWLDMISKLIQELVDVGWNKQICQIKEKFGGLRFYTNGLTEGQHQLVRKYESLSYETCEVCGNPGETRPGGWVRTLCDKHVKKEQDESK